MAELAIVSFKVEQTEAQVKLRTVRLEYAYTLTPSPDECRRGVVFGMTVTILGDDVLRDKVLVAGVDEHRITCEAGMIRRPISGRRELIVGQQLLDEDIGTDEIKLRIIATPDKGEPASVDTPVVRGHF
jgi:hypothetical protein